MFLTFSKHFSDHRFSIEKTEARVWSYQQKFSDLKKFRKFRKFQTYHFCPKGQKNYPADVLA
jgi:hypothetical protein